MTTARRGFTILLIAGLSAGTVAADQRVDHFEGEPAETLEQAVANAAEYNARLAEILAKDDLAPADHARIHQLTYTLENALQTINEKLTRNAEDLEALHVASERADSDAVRKHGHAYLDTSRMVIR